jgi:hypothetical protein
MDATQEAWLLRQAGVDGQEAAVLVGEVEAVVFSIDMKDVRFYREDEDFSPVAAVLLESAASRVPIAMSERSPCPSGV